MRIVFKGFVALAFVLLFPHMYVYAANSELTIAGGATLTLSSNVNLRTGGNLNIGTATSAATVACKPASATTNTRILIDAGGNLSISVGSVIHGNALGYSAQYGPLSPSDYTSTPNTQTDYAGKSGPTEYTSGGGGGHHGAGGAGMNGGAGGLAYGNCSAPATMGSGGGRGEGSAGQYAPGGNGGGSITITVVGTVAINGSITADGAVGGSVGTSAGGGGGAGGSIFITAQALGGTGTLSVRGGNGGLYGGGGGSGGHLVVNASITTPPTIIIAGGAGYGGGANGADGCTNLVPQPPTNLVGAPDSTNTITWTWTDNSSNETGFVIHDSAHAQIGSVGANVTSWQEGSLSENGSYGRHVHALMGTSESTPTNSELPYTLVHNPTTGDFALTPLSSWQIQIVITAPSNGTTGQTGVRIEQSLDNNQFDIISDFSQTYTIISQPLLAGMTYYYRITFRNADGVATALSPVNSVATLSVPVPVITTPNKKINDTTPLVSGTSLDGFTVKVYEGTNLLGTTVVPPGGAWSLSTSVLPESPHTLTATATDPGANESGVSNSTTITIDITPPSAPQELHATATNGMVMLEWNANTEADLLGYNIYRKAPGEQSFTKINPQVVTVASFCDTDIVNNQEYEYRVTSVDNTTMEE